MAEQRIPNPQVGGSIPSWPAIFCFVAQRRNGVKTASNAPVGVVMKGYVMSEAAASRLDPLKWGVVVLLIAAGVVGNSYYSDESLLYRVMALIVAAIVAGYVASRTVRGGAFWQLVKGARTEIRKVVWPTRQETTQTTMIVVVFVFVMALILWAMDSILGWLVSMVIG